ncbi:MAG: Multifunctional alkaline phosphatase superfamily protein PehA [Anaerolineales bacterium]|nr:Multifunctional alkaline phosphatase superfamily protein PehA [Anaerolineales bacterium]
MNIILVIFDSLRKDCVGAYGSPPWGKVHTPHFDAFAEQSLLLTRAYPESLPTLPARRAIYTGRRVYPFHNADFRLKGDFVGAPGWGPIPEEQPTLAEILREAGYRTGLIADLYHMFKPSKNFWRGFDQWMFLRGQETDPARSGPRLTQEEIDHWLPEEMRGQGQARIDFIQQCIMNIHDRRREEDYFAPRVLKEAACWLEENRDAGKFFLTVESFDPHEPWLVPPHYREMYLTAEGQEQVVSAYGDVSDLDEALLTRTRANYSGEVTMCDRWFGYFMESLRVLGLLDNTLVILASDHGHSIGDRNYLGKRGYPSTPEVFDLPLMIRFPQAEHAGETSDMFVQFHDITATILERAKVEPSVETDGIPFLEDASAGKTGPRNHATVAWGSAITVITGKWWFNCKVDGTGVLLHDLEARDPFAVNVADEHPDVVNELFAQAEADAGGRFPDWLVDLAKNQADAPGCSDLVARVQTKEAP